MVAPRPQQTQVESYDEQMYRCQPNDTFQSISTRFYLSDKYDKALLLFNRSHPLGCAGCRQEPPILRPGENVYLPPLFILEKRYSASIPDLKPVAPTPPSAVPSMGNRTGQIAGASPSQAKFYRVRGRGERFIDIAKHSLGDICRWREIYQMNPTHPPDKFIPGGTVLNLPADARVH
jgi:hypothetical protein